MVSLLLLAFSLSPGTRSWLANKLRASLPRPLKSASDKEALCCNPTQNLARRRQDRRPGLRFSWALALADRAQALPTRLSEPRHISSCFSRSYFVSEKFCYLEPPTANSPSTVDHGGGRVFGVGPWRSTSMKQSPP